MQVSGSDGIHTPLPSFFWFIFGHLLIVGWFMLLSFGLLWDSQITEGLIINTVVPQGCIRY